jgi:hypothetical protein
MPAALAAPNSLSRLPTVPFSSTLSPTSFQAAPRLLRKSFCGSVTTNAVSLLLNFTLSSNFKVGKSNCVSSPPPIVPSSEVHPSLRKCLPAFGAIANTVPPLCERRLTPKKRGQIYFSGKVRPKARPAPNFALTLSLQARGEGITRRQSAAAWRVAGDLIGWRVR